MSQCCAYDKWPVVQITDTAAECTVGWEDIVAHIAKAGPRTICVECYPGAPVDLIVSAFAQGCTAATIIDTRDLFRSPSSIEDMLAPLLGDDPVFAKLHPVGIDTFLDTASVDAARDRIAKASGQHVVVIGTGAAHVAQHWSTLIHVSMARWELQGRQRRNEIGNLGLTNLADRPQEKYRRAFFIDWRVGDRIKKGLLTTVDFIIDANQTLPVMIDGDTYRDALAVVVKRPFRVVPFFDPGSWGGQWMRKRFDLPAEAPNFAWCFDCVPEENSLVLGFGDVAMELPAIDVVFAQPTALLGDYVADRFGAEFPIRFDLLDTMDGGNLSLQVHPKQQFANDSFGLTYTQDESYYILDAQDNAVVYLGLTDDAEPEAFAQALRAAQAGGPTLDVDRYVNRIAARRHDHFLIPAGTIHCSGSGCMVLEVSATPYIFTFKLWDWGRLGLDGRPRPIHLDHGLANIDWARRTSFVHDELVNQVRVVEQTDAHRRELTGLHALQFIATERTWFSDRVEMDTDGSVNVLNLVAGDAAVIESPVGAFEPFEVHYAETFIVPAGVSRFTARPLDDGDCALLRAWVRRDAS